MVNLSDVRAGLRTAQPEITQVIFDEIAPKLILDLPRKPSSPKQFNDPVWRTIELQPDEVAVLDMPLLQRLRRIRQLGLANLVYPGANHTRFDHSLGALEATERMFQRLTRLAGVEADLKQKLRRRARFAALLHDCGHCCFSHVSENVLKALLEQQFYTIGKKLDELLPEAYLGPAYSEPGEYDRAPPPPSEVLSVLLVLSPSFEALGHKIHLSSDDILSIAALILGRPSGLKSTDEHNEYLFVKSLISGDLDADKLDYVARDAYFAGIPIAADVDRLISQLDAIKLTVPESYSSHSQIQRYVIGVKYSGVSAVEMFVMTRSYVFDRIYSHPKIRGAERLMERFLVKLCSTMNTENRTGYILRFLFGTCDDVIMSDESDNEILKHFSDRTLLERATAISRRLTYGYNHHTGNTIPSVTQMWTRGEDALYRKTQAIEDLIKASLKMDPSCTVIVDSNQKNPIKENPEIWVSPPYHGKPPERINRYFDAEKYANAYQDIKETTWIFCGHEHRAKVAAAGTLVIYKNFGLALSDEAYAKSKVQPDDVCRELLALKKIAESEGNFDIVGSIEQITRSKGRIALIPSKWIERRCPRGWPAADKIAFSDKMSNDFYEIGFPSDYLEDIDRVLPVLEKCLEHQLWAAQAGKTYESYEDEKKFRDDVRSYISSDAEFMKDYSIDKEVDNPMGRCDLVIQGTDLRKIVVELKKKDKEFFPIVEDYAAQPMHYTTSSGFNRVSIFYAEYLSDDPVKDCDIVKVRKNVGADTSPLAVVCIGLRRTSGSASNKSMSKRNQPVS